MPVHQDNLSFHKVETHKRGARPAPHTRALHSVDITVDQGHVSLFVALTDEGKCFLDRHLGEIAKLWGCYLVDRDDTDLLIRRALAVNLNVRLDGKTLVTP